MSVSLSSFLFVVDTDSRRTLRPGLMAVPVVVAACAVLALPVTAIVGRPHMSDDDAAYLAAHDARVPFRGTHDDAGASLRELAAMHFSSNLLPAPLPSEVQQDDLFEHETDMSDMTIVWLDTNEHRGSVGERFARSALSIIKLYIADYVLDHGTSDEGDAALEMIRDSDDAIAESLFDAYPESIDATAEKYHLLSTRAADRWGYSLTSSYDVAYFLAQVISTQPESPLLEAMASSESFAADGYLQDFGTAVLPGAIGSKWGWSNDVDLHASVTFGISPAGRPYVAAAWLLGSAPDLSALCESSLKDAVDEGDADMNT